MSNIELEDLVYTYPDIDDENFQTLISAKKEFRDVSGIVSEPTPENGELFRHQKFLLRYMLQYDRILVVWDTGTGKSRGVSGITEYFKNLKNSPYKHTYFLARGKNLLNEFEKQLYPCLDDEYMSNIRKKGEIGRRLKKKMEEYYTFSTYTTFAKSLQNMTDEGLILQYSGSIIIIDEIHNLRIDPNKEFYVDDDEGHPEEKIKNLQETYRQLYRLFHLVKRCKIILLSATPMINTSREIAPIMNLLLPEDQNIPINVDWQESTLEEVEPYFRSRISYVRASDTGAKKTYEGKTMNVTYEGYGVKSQMVVYPVLMSKFQSKHFLETVKNKKKREGAFHMNERQSSNMVFPDGQSGSKGFKKYFKPATRQKITTNVTGGESVMETVKIPNKFSIKKELRMDFNSSKGIKKLSTKFYNVLKLCKASHGNCWVYINFVEGSGAIALSTIFEENGFERFDEKSSIFKEKQQSLCPPEIITENTTEQGERKERKVRISKKLRYALLSGKTTENQVASMLEAQKSYENRHGDYIKVMIGTPVSRDGLNLGNVLNIFLVDSAWNKASDYQAESRAIRATSQDDLIWEERKRLEKEGKDPNTATVLINVYRLASIPVNTKGEPLESESLDLNMYEVSETKDLEIKKVFRMMKQSSVDCVINYDRNTRDEDVDGTAICDYDVCKYKCFGEIIEEDTTSFDVLYSGDLVEEITKKIKELFKFDSSMTLQRLYEKLDQYKNKYVEMAVDKIINKKEMIVDRYGYQTYLTNDNESLYLEKTFPLSDEHKKTKYNLSIYTGELLALERKSLKNYVSFVEKFGIEDEINNLSSIPSGSEEFKECIRNMSNEAKIELFEHTIITFVTSDKSTEAMDGILKLFESSYLALPEQSEEVKRIQKSLEGKKGAGRPPKNNIPKLKVNIIKVLPKKNKAEIIYIHKLSDRDDKLVTYGETSEFLKGKGTYKIFKPSEGNGWRFLTRAENIVYPSYFREHIDEKLSEFEDQYEIYGLVLKSGIFKIVDNRVKIEKTNKRKRKTGLACNSWSKPKLIEILWDMAKENEEYNPFHDIDTGAKKEKMRKTISNVFKSHENLEIDKFTTLQLKFYYLAITRTQKANLCEYVKKFLIDHERAYFSTI